VPPADCLKAMAGRVDGVDVLEAKFCRYSQMMAPLIMRGVKVNGVCKEECGHTAIFDIDAGGRVSVSNETFDTE
jgi:hypothetical protein